jgi:hypothetical protein
VAWENKVEPKLYETEYRHHLERESTNYGWRMHRYKIPAPFLQTCGPLM